MVQFYIRRKRKSFLRIHTDGKKIQLFEEIKNTLHSKNLVWVVAEDSPTCTSTVSAVLSRPPFRRLRRAHLASPMPARYRSQFYLPRGVAARNAGMDFAADKERGRKSGRAVVYFGDDDNTYDLG